MRKNVSFVDFAGDGVNVQENGKGVIVYISGASEPISSDVSLNWFMG